jgi:hypothetical protein
MSDVRPADSEHSRINDAIEALKGGSDLSELNQSSEDVLDDSDIQLVSGSDAINSLGISTEDNEPEETVEAAPSEVVEDPEEQVSEAVREIQITDHRGRRKIKVDFSDEAKLEKYVKQAAGFRKMQAERDKALASLESSKGLEEKANHFTELEQVYETNGVEGLIDRLLGEGAHSEYVNQQFERIRMREAATPEELAALDANEKSARLEREMQRLRAEQEARAEQVSKQAEQAEMDNLQSMINPTFEKYRFAGKLGDNVKEHELDQMVWGAALNKLERLENNGVKINKSVIDKQFKETANLLRKTINAESNKKTNKVIQQKKISATKDAQMATSKSMGQNNQAADLIKKGDYAGFFRNFGGKIKI